jgi:hypothetical protein
MMMHFQSRPHRFAFIVAILVAVLAALNWALHPEEGSRWIPAMFGLPAIWVGMTAWLHWTLRSRARRGAGDESAVRDYFASTVALLFLAVGSVRIVQYGLKLWAEFGDRVDIDLERRILGLTASAAIVVLGNGLPKILTPLAILPPSEAARVTAARRFIGLVWVMLGSTMAVIFLFAPLAIALTGGPWVFGACLLTMVAGVLWMNAGPAGEGR